MFGLFVSIHTILILTLTLLMSVYITIIKHETRRQNLTLQYR